MTSWGHVDESYLSGQRTYLAGEDDPCNVNRAPEQPNAAVALTGPALFRHATARQKQKAWRESQAAFDKYLRMYSHSTRLPSRTLADAHYGRALCHAKLGRRAKLAKRSEHSSWPCW